MPWSIFGAGGGPGAAYTWAKDLLKRLGAPATAGNTQFVFDWETSEGGGGKFNPLNQGPVPGKPSLTTTGQQFGGGAADYASWAAGLTGAADYLSMPSYRGIADALRRNQPAEARSRLIASPWAASHYGYGAAFSDQPLPGKASALAPAGGAAAGGGAGGGGFLGLPGAITGLGSTLKTAAIVAPIVVVGGALVVVGAAKATGMDKRAKAAGDQVKDTATKAATVAAVA
jgi:hypothetical protein